MPYTRHSGLRTKSSARPMHLPRSLRSCAELQLGLEVEEIKAQTCIVDWDESMVFGHARWCCKRFALEDTKRTWEVAESVSFLNGQEKIQEVPGSSRGFQKRWFRTPVVK